MATRREERLYLAGQALSSLDAAQTAPETVATWAVAYADAVLAELDRTETPEGEASAPL